MKIHAHALKFLACLLITLGGCTAFNDPEEFGLEGSEACTQLCLTIDENCGFNGDYYDDFAECLRRVLLL